MKKNILIRAASDLLYPRRCPFCDCLLGGREAYVCKDCASDLPFIRGPVCMKCGRPLEDKATGTEEYCDNCRRRPHLFEKGFAPFPYRGAVQISMMRLKYGNRPEYTDFYAAAVTEYGKYQFDRWDPQLLVPVPIHRRRYITRGYNQAELLGQKISGRLDLPMDARSIIRKKNTSPQKGLSPAGRRRNLKNAFVLSDDFERAGRHFPDRVLIVDDIYTTGSTVDALTEVLMAHGARQVFFSCICVSPGMS